MQVLDLMAETCESISDVDGAELYKTEADQLAATFYGSSATLNPPQDAADSQQNLTSPRETAFSPRDPASLRRFVGVQVPDSPPANGAAVSETEIREGVATMMSRLGMSTPGPGDVEDSVSIRQAERDLHETVTKTGGADVIGLAMPSAQTSSDTELRDSSLASDHLAGRHPSPQDFSAYRQSAGQFISSDS